MNIFVIAAAGRGANQLVCGTPIMDFCSLVLFLGGAFLLAIAAYHLKKAPDQVESLYR